MTLLVALLAFAAVIIIGGIIVIMIARLAKRVLGPPPPGSQTNNTGFVVTGIIQLPNFQFSPLPTPAGQTAETPMGLAYLVIERSTNMVNWEPVATNTGGESFYLDPNPSIPMEFFRGKVVYP